MMRDAIVAGLLGCVAGYLVSVARSGAGDLGPRASASEVDVSLRTADQSSIEHWVQAPRLAAEAVVGSPCESVPAQAVPVERSVSGRLLSPPDPLDGVGAWREYVRELERLVLEKQVMCEMRILPSQMTLVFKESKLISSYENLCIAAGALDMKAVAEALRIESEFTLALTRVRSKVPDDSAERWRHEQEVVTPWFHEELGRLCDSLYQLQMPMRLVEAFRAAWLRTEAK